MVSNIYIQRDERRLTRIPTRQNQKNQLSLKDSLKEVVAVCRCLLTQGGSLIQVVANKNWSLNTGFVNKMWSLNTGLQVFVYVRWSLNTGLQVFVYERWSLNTGLQVLVYERWSIKEGLLHNS
jgi:hypothetical protein